MSDKPDNISVFPGETSLPIPADRVLNEAVGQFDRVIVIGRLKSGGYEVRSSWTAAQEINWMLDRAKFRLHQTCDGDE